MKILKKMMLVIVMVFILNLGLLKNNFIKAGSYAKVYLVFDKTSYNTNDIINLNINLDQFANLSEASIQIRLEREYLEPVLVDNQYFYFSHSSIFNKAIINDFVDDSDLRLRLLKDEKLSEGYFSSYKNNLCNIKLKAKKPIDNIYEYFTDDDFDNKGISIHLFDTNNKTMAFQIEKLEKIKINWDIENYELEVYSSIPNFKEDIKILNRQSGEYEYLEEKEIDTLTIGLKTIHITIYDKLGADYIVLSKAVNVVDSSAPTITCPKALQINDWEIAKTTFFEGVSSKDNYDKDVEMLAKYYNNEEKEIATLEAFKTYLSTNQEGYIKYIAKDTSGNTCVSDLISVLIIDTTFPIINELNKIIINDIDVDDLDLEKKFIVSDNYDPSPKIIFNFYEYNTKTIEEIKALLKVGVLIKFSYCAIDESHNQTASYEVEIIVIDTIKPTISIDDVKVNDVDYQKTNLEKSLKVEDNFQASCQIIKTYYLEEEIVTKALFDEGLLKGKKGYITYKAVDSGNNMSNIARQIIEVVDTTNPKIIIKNIENDKKYIKLDYIDYEIQENFLIYEATILLDDKPYNSEALSTGKHKFYIYVKDRAGNDTSLTINFEVIEDNIIGCGGDASCYVENYLEVVIIVASLLIFILIMIIVRIFLKRKNRKIT